MRVADDGMVVNDEIYEPGKGGYSKPFIEIAPGRIAILSTVERLCMPGDLVGKLGIRLDYASKGLTGLMGTQVDPYYGRNHPAERLYIKVANFGNEPVRFSPGEAVFNIEFSEVKGASDPNKPSTWERIKKSLADQKNIDWTHMTQVQTDFQCPENRLVRDIDNVREGYQSTVMFGVFLVAITILGVMLAILLSVDNPPNWVAEGGWIALFALFFVAVMAIVGFVSVAGYVLWKTRIRNDAKSG